VTEPPRPRRPPPAPLRAAPPRPRPPPTWDAPRPPAPTLRDERWAALLGGRAALARAGWGRRARAWGAAPQDVRDLFLFDAYWHAVLKRIRRLDDVDPRWLDELDALGVTLKQLRWLAGPGDGCLPEKVTRQAALATFLRDVAAGRRRPAEFEAVKTAHPKVGVGARPKRKRKQRR
jgi:hypothetical protein